MVQTPYILSDGSDIETTVIPRIDARAFISFATPRTWRLNEAGV